MEIKTTFNIGDLIQYKFQRRDNDAKIDSFYEILFVQTDSCNAGTQIFYLCRPIHVSYDSNYVSGKKIWMPEDFMPAKPREGDFQKFREDEVVAVSERIFDIMKQFNINQK